MSEDLVEQVRGLTGNLSGVVEGLPVEFVAQRRREALARAKTAEATVAAWNAFSSKHGSFADEHSTL